MAKKNSPDQAVPEGQKKKKKGSGLLGRIVRRFFLVLFTVIVLAFAALCLVMNLIFNGPSPAARDMLTMTLIEASATKWVPALFIGQEAVDQIRTSTNAGMEEEQTDVSKVVIDRNSLLATSDEWAAYPDGIRIETLQYGNFDAYVMIVQDPSQVYMGISTERFTTSIPGKRINQAIEDEKALAAINAGAFNDNGKVSDENGSCPLGLVMASGKCVWEAGKQPGLEGFAGFTEDDVLVVSAKNLKKSQAAELGIRDGCCFGPALIINGEVNLDAYNDKSGANPRTAIGQRADGAVIFVCADGRQAGSLGATYAEITDIMVEYGAVNACNMDGGSSTVMMYRDTYGRYGEAGEVRMINSYSLFQEEPRRMPNFWMVRSK